MKRANLPSEGEPESGSGLLAGDEGPPRAAHGSIEEENEARVRLSVRGMTCAACALAVEKALRSVPGVRSAVVNAAAGAAAVRFDAARAKLPA
ncbi:MAG: heavy-metal-associated domain-containing protein, partial [Candidatus Eisenbacteria bacterium]|nr:heavy-metal-associated domain-containing protein [Candidatus Eisenbacteria bacterium]